MKKKWYFIEDIDRLDSPALTVYPDRIQNNINMMIGMVKDPSRLRPHVKTYKMREVVKMQMQSGINKFKCATIAEAEMLAISGAKDVLLAYQPVGPKLDRLIELVKKYQETKFSILVDDENVALEVAEKCKKHLVLLNVYIDINNGNNRTGIPTDGAFYLFKKCIELKGIRPVGLHVYDGHIRDSDPGIRKKHCDDDFQKVSIMADYIERKLDIKLITIAGGSPTFPIHANRENVICSPGTSLFWDAGYSENFSDIAFLPAAIVISRVISKPARGFLCLDLGHKSIAGENPIQNRVRFLNYSGLNPVSHSEEHFVVENKDDLPISIGDVIYGIPFHICPTIALYNGVTVIKNNKIAEDWQILARGRKITV